MTGATLDEFNRIRETIVAETAVSLVARADQESLRRLQPAANVDRSSSTSTSPAVRMSTACASKCNPAFDQAEEVAADEMALVVYRALVSLHAAVTFHLYETARPLPQMLDFKFAAPRPTLVLSHRLYDTAARADELREENKVVHPAFAPREGRALAF